MAGESDLGNFQQEQAQSIQDLNLTNDEESFENSDGDNDFSLHGFALQDINVSNLQVLHSGLVEKEILSVSPDIIDGTDTGKSKTLLSTELEVNDYGEEDFTDSEEEKTIMKEIRHVIESKVRIKMKDELSGHHECMQAVGSSDEPENMFLGQFEAFSQMDGDPRLQEAMMKMKKLDNILLRKIQVEKKVKRNRILFEKRMRQEIAEMTKGVKMQQDIMINTEKFLALEPPASHNEGVNLDDIEGEHLPPFFQTQINETEGLWEHDNELSCSINGETGTDRTESLFKESSKSKLENKGKKQKTDFIKRNKELAANADQSVAMTDDEKKRLAELLEGVDELSDPEEPVEKDSANESNLCPLALHPGEGFCPDNSEMETLASIDERLQTLLPDDEYQSFFRPTDGLLSNPDSQLFDRVGIPTQAPGTDLQDRYRERVLYETKDERELKARLQSIEQELDMFSAPNEDESAEDCHLTDEQLDILLDQCAIYMTTSASVGSPELSARSIASSRLSLQENPPKLTDEQLQKLLSDAHFPMSSRLMSLKENEDKIFEDKICTEVIRAETWKAIKDVDLEEQCVSVGECPSQFNLDDDPECQLELSDSVALNVSNNHNKNIFTTSSTSNSHDDEDNEQEPVVFVPVTSPPRHSVFESIHTCASGSAATSLHGSSVSLPRISHSNGVSRSESYLDHFITGNTSNLLPQESTEDVTRLPNISVKSFLVHAQQGITSVNEKDKVSSSTKQPLEIMCDDLSDMKYDSSLDDKGELRGQVYGCKSSGKIISGTQPRSLKDRQCKDRHVLEK